MRRLGEASPPPPVDRTLGTGRAANSFNVYVSEKPEKQYCLCPSFSAKKDTLDMSNVKILCKYCKHFIKGKDSSHHSSK